MFHYFNMDGADEITMQFDFPEPELIRMVLHSDDWAGPWEEWDHKSDLKQCAQIVVLQCGF